MKSYSSRVMCHDDIRAIRKVYGLSVRRENIQYDQICRRDFPMNYLQKIFYRIHRRIYFYVFYWGLTSSLIVICITGIYLILKNYFFHRENLSSRSSLQSDYSSQSIRKEHQSQMNAFLWHDDLPFN